jgi:hypothetical protein
MPDLVALADQLLEAPSEDEDEDEDDLDPDLEMDDRTSLQVPEVQARELAQLPLEAN